MSGEDSGEFIPVPENVEEWVGPDEEDDVEMFETHEYEPGQPEAVEQQQQQTLPDTDKLSGEVEMFEPEYALDRAALEGRYEDDPTGQEQQQHVEKEESPDLAESPKNAHTRRNRALLTVVVGIMIGIAVMGLVLGLGYRDDDTTNRAASATTTTTASESPTPSPPRSEDEDTTEATTAATTATGPTTTTEDIFPPLVLDEEGNPIRYTYNVTDSCAQVVAALKKLHAGLELPDHLVVNDLERRAIKAAEDFDVSTYWGALSYVSRAPGKEMDYVYHFDGATGYPILYAHDEDKEPFDNISLYNTACPQKDACSHLQALEVDGLPQSIVEVVALHVLGEQFYLFSHAAMNDDTIIYNNQTLYQVFEENSFHTYDDGSNPSALGETDLEDLVKMDLSPIVKMDPDENEVLVTIFTFSEWGGFLRKTYEVTKGEEAGEIAKVEMKTSEVLVYYVKG